MDDSVPAYVRKSPKIHESASGLQQFLGLLVDLSELQCGEVDHDVAALHLEFCQLLPLRPDGAARPCAVLLDLPDEGCVFWAGREEEALADELRADDLLLVVELALALVEDSRAGLLGALELLVEGAGAFGVLFVLAVAGEVGVDADEYVGGEVDVGVDVLGAAEDLGEDGEAELPDGLDFAELVLDGGGVEEVFEDADVELEEASALDGVVQLAEQRQRLHLQVEVVLEDVLLQHRHQLLRLPRTQLLRQRQQRLRAVGPHLHDAVAHVLYDVPAAGLEVELLPHVRHEKANAPRAVGCDLLLVALAVPHHVLQTLPQLLLPHRSPEHARLRPVRQPPGDLHHRVQRPALPRQLQQRLYGPAGDVFRLELWAEGEVAEQLDERDPNEGVVLDAGDGGEGEGGVGRVLLDEGGEAVEEEGLGAGEGGVCPVVVVDVGEGGEQPQVVADCDFLAVGADELEQEGSEGVLADARLALPRGLTVDQLQFIEVPLEDLLHELAVVGVDSGQEVGLQRAPDGLPALRPQEDHAEVLLRQPREVVQDLAHQPVLVEGFTVVVADAEVDDLQEPLIDVVAAAEVALLDFGPPSTAADQH